MPAYLSIESVSVSYGATPVLNNVSLDIERGEMVALLGSSGCGKTTLLRAIAGFVRPRAGRIVVDGRDITALPPEARQTAMMFQSYALWPHMNVAANIGYGLRMRGVAKARIAERVQEMLKLLQLEGYGSRDVAALSGGQRQRVALGRALAVDPLLLLLDEPMSNLDYKVRLELRHELRALQQRVGITAIYVTHDREEALTLADRIAVVDAGRVVQYGKPEEVFHRPASPFVAGFMGADNAIDLVAGRQRAAAGRRDHAARRIAARAFPRRPRPAGRRSADPEADTRTARHGRADRLPGQRLPLPRAHRRWPDLGRRPRALRRRQPGPGCHSPQRAAVLPGGDPLTHGSRRRLS